VQISLAETDFLADFWFGQPANPIVWAGEDGRCWSPVSASGPSWRVPDGRNARLSFLW